MKKIFMIAVCIVSVQAFAQRNLDANRQADSLKASRIKKEGAVTGNLMQFDGLKWGAWAHNFLTNNVYIGDGNITGPRILKGSAEAYPLYFDSLQYFSVNTNLGVRINSRGSLGTSILHGNEIRFATTATQTLLLHPSRLIMGVNPGGDFGMAIGAPGGHNIFFKGYMITAPQIFIWPDRSDTVATRADIPHIATTGTNVTVTGTGTWANPFVINATPGGGGSVGSVGATVSGALSVSGSPITTSGILAFSWTGSNTQYVRGDGTLATFPAVGAGSVTSVDATATGALSFTGAPITGAGTLALGWTGANTQYVRGDGTLATFPAVGAGSVTNLSAGTLSPLFSTSVATSTSTPALSFSLSNAAANTWFGNATAGSTTPSYNAAGALTKTDDANVTLTLGGTPASAMLKAVSLTVGWTGTLSVARGGTGAATLTGVLIGNGTSAITGLTLGALQSFRRNAGNTAYEAYTPSTGTVISVGAGNGLNFATITGTGNIVLGTPSSITLASTNSVSANSHTHQFQPGGSAAQYIRGDGSLATLPTSANWWMAAQSQGIALYNYLIPDFNATPFSPAGVHTGGGYGSKTQEIDVTTFDVGNYANIETFSYYGSSSVTLTMPDPASHQDRVIQVVHAGTGTTAIAVAATYLLSNALNSITSVPNSGTDKPYSVTYKSCFVGGGYKWVMIASAHK